MEQWKDVIGFEGIYEISDFGNIRSVKTNQIKKQTIHINDPRPYVNLWVNGKQKIMRPHRLVLEAFIGPCPNGMEGCHNDGNPQNNHLSNLRWDTKQENCKDKIRHNTHNKGIKHPLARLTESQVLDIRNDTRTQNIICKEYGVTQTLISQIKLRKKWKHL